MNTSMLLFSFVFNLVEALSCNYAASYSRTIDLQLLVAFQKLVDLAEAIAMLSSKSSKKNTNQAIKTKVY